MATQDQDVLHLSVTTDTTSHDTKKFQDLGNNLAHNQLLLISVVWLPLVGPYLEDCTWKSNKRTNGNNLAHNQYLALKVILEGPFNV